MARKTDDIPPMGVSLREAARLIGVCERTLWSMVQRGQIPVRVVGTGKRRRYLFSLRALEKWLVGADIRSGEEPMEAPYDRQRNA